MRYTPYQLFEGLRLKKAGIAPQNVKFNWDER